MHCCEVSVRHGASQLPACLATLTVALAMLCVVQSTSAQENLPPPSGDAGILPLEPPAETLPGEWGPGEWGPGELGPFDPGYGPNFEGATEGPLAEAPTFQLGTIDQWFTLEEWDASFEAGINGSDGNSDTFNLHTGFEFNRASDLSESLIRLRYNINYAEQVETQNNAILQTRHEWLFPDSPWSAFVNGDMLYDQFKAFDLRLVFNGGVGYTHIKTENTTFKTRYGAGVSREIGGPDNRWVPEALFGLDFTRQLTRRQKLNATVDYYPEWSDYRDFRLVSNFNWELLVDEEANLSLKLNVTDQYDSTPNGVEPHDINYALLLLWKL